MFVLEGVAGLPLVGLMTMIPLFQCLFLVWVAYRLDLVMTMNLSRVNRHISMTVGGVAQRVDLVVTMGGVGHRLDVLVTMDQ